MKSNVEIIIENEKVIVKNMGKTPVFLKYQGKKYIFNPEPTKRIALI